MNALVETYPVTELVLKFTTAGEHGEAVTTIETISGEDAEFLPHILKRIERFLAATGFDVSLSVEDDASKRLGPALQALYQRETCAAL